MKKCIGILLLAATLFTLSACGQPKDVSDEYYEYAKQAIDAADSYTDGLLGGSEAYSKITDLVNNTELPDPVSETEESIVENVSILESCMNYVMYNMASADDVIQCRNLVATLIGKREK